jgi:anthranilate phosphoribosyltransferase
MILYKLFIKKVWGVMIKECIKKLVVNQDLTIGEAKRAMDEVLDGGAVPAQIAAFLVALRMKGETIDEITGCALTMKEKAAHIHPKAGNYIDFVGTGGDGANTFNISTTSAFVISACGVPVAKHGNRAVSSRSGSADVLEALGVNIMIAPEQAQKCVDEINLGFMFARTFHKFMSTAAGVRSELNIRTVFNILGPISNPSDAKSQVIGVFDPKLAAPIAGAMLNMGVERALVMSGMDDGMDEFSISGATAVSEIKGGAVTDYVLTPEEIGLPRYDAEEIRGGNAEENAKYTLGILEGRDRGAKRDIVLFNAAAGLYVGGAAPSVRDGVAVAAEAIDSGEAKRQLDRLVKITNSF